MEVVTEDTEPVNFTQNLSEKKEAALGTSSLHLEVQEGAEMDRCVKIRCKNKSTHKSNHMGLN